MTLKRVGKLAHGPRTGTWFRAIRLKHWGTRLFTVRSRTTSSRFSQPSAVSPGHRMLYLGENHQVVLYEVEALFGPSNAVVPNPAGSWVLMSLGIVLNCVIDLSVPAQQSVINTNDQELTGNWSSNAAIAPTQRLGAALHGLPGVEGAIFPSSKIGGGRNLFIFVDKLHATSRIVFLNELNKNNETIA